MNREEQLLAGIPEYLSIEMMLKATPATEGTKRFIYLEASREARDLQNDMVLAKALENSAGHYLKFGNLDIDHKSMPSVAEMHGIKNPGLWEIGTPVDVRFDGASTFVKAQLLSGPTELAEKANMVWESMTLLDPPRKWYPSVGGSILAKSTRIDTETGDKYGVVSGVRWTNIALSQHPVNQHVAGVTTIPLAVLAKSFGSGHSGLLKALEASYATDAVGKTGGAAFGMQSLDMGAGGAPHGYHAFKRRLSEDMNLGLVEDGSPSGLVAYCTSKFSLSHDDAVEWVDRFRGHLKSGLMKLKTNGVFK